MRESDKLFLVRLNSLPFKGMIQSLPEISPKHIDRNHYAANSCNLNDTIGNCLLLKRQAHNRNSGIPGSNQKVGHHYTHSEQDLAQDTDCKHPHSSLLARFADGA